MINETQARIEELQSLEQFILNAPNIQAIGDIVKYKIRFYQSLLENDAQQSSDILSDSDKLSPNVNSLVAYAGQRNRPKTIIVKSRDRCQFDKSIDHMIKCLTKKNALPWSVVCLYDTNSSRTHFQAIELQKKYPSICAYDQNLDPSDLADFTHIVCLFGVRESSANSNLKHAIYNRIILSRTKIGDNQTIIFTTDSNEFDDLAEIPSNSFNPPPVVKIAV